MPKIGRKKNTYNNLLIACLQAPNCKAFDTWGFTDLHSWIAAPGEPLPFDNKYKKKGCYNAMHNTLLNYPRDAEAVVERNRQLKEREEYVARVRAEEPETEVIADELIEDTEELTPEEYEAAIAEARAHEAEIRSAREEAIREAKAAYEAEQAGLEFLQE